MKLQFKLIIAFGGIVIVMALLQSFFFQHRVENDFQDYVSQNDQEKIEYWKGYIIDYYHYYNSFEGIQGIIEYNTIYNRPKRGYMGGNNLYAPMIDNFQIIIADADGKVIADSESVFIGAASEEINGVHEDLVLDGKKIGELIIYREKNIGFLNIEQQFISSVNQSIFFGAIISVIIAVIFGILISNRITKPLEKLMVGIRQLSKGDTSYRVIVDTKDEFNQLANAFNDMSKKLKQNEEVRRNLVADVAHELRTPLAILSGRLESIQEGAIEPTQEIVIQLNDEVYRLTRLVNDLQQLGLAEAGKLPLNKKNTELNDLIKRVIYHFNWLAEEKDIIITFIEQDYVTTNIDPDRITQVIINLLGNALRHTPEKGKVTIVLDKDQENVNIKISDTGPGIDEEHLPYIFDRFYRTDSSRTRDEGGTGLGLSIAKGFIEAHEGFIIAESKKDTGTTFTIVLPIKNQQ